MRPAVPFVALIVASQILTAVVSLSLSPVSAQEVSDGEAQQAAGSLKLKFYPLGELALPPRQYPFQADLPTSTADRFAVPPYAAGSLSGGGGFGGGAGGSGGGGGLFSVATPVQPGSEFGGYGGAVDFGMQNQSVELSEGMHQIIIGLLVDNIEPDSWEDNGGHGRVSSVNDTLLIRQTEVNHKAIGTFLKNLFDSTVGGQPLTLQAWWLPLNAGAKHNLQTILDAKDGAESKLAAVTELNEASGGYHATLQCRNRVTGNVSSGHCIPLVTAVQASVGTNASGYTPHVRFVNVGLMLEVRPELQESWQGDAIRVAIRTAVTTQAESTVPAHTPGLIDRFSIGSHVLETNTICEPGRPVIAAGLTAVGLFPDGEEDRELVLIIVVERAE